MEVLMEPSSETVRQEAKFEERLIEEVRSYEHLWKVASTKYKDLQRCENSWSEISMTLNEDQAKCKSKWRYLRDTYTRKKKEYSKKSGSGRENEKKWEFFDVLSFLSNSSKVTKSASNVPDKENTQAENDTTDTTQDCSSGSSRKRNSDRFETLLIDALGTWKKCISEQNNTLTEDEAFGRSVAIQMNKLSIGAKARVKLRIQEVICEAEESEMVKFQENTSRVNNQDHYPISYTDEGSYFQLHSDNYQ